MSRPGGGCLSLGSWSVAQASGGSAGGKPYFVKCGLNHVTKLTEGKKAALVIIAHDVEPIEVSCGAAAAGRTTDITLGCLTPYLCCPPHPPD